MSFSGWRKTKVDEVAEAIFSGGTPNTKIEEYWNGEYNWLSSGETRNAYIKQTEKTITSEGVNNSSTRLALKDDVVIASAGQGYTRGQVSYCMIDTYINQSIIAIRAKKDELLPKYLFFNLRNRYEELRQISDGNSIRGSITTKHIKALDIFIPPLPEQKAIAATLSVLDDLIELNNQINKTLEEMAQAIFKSWFVDFEPFKDGEFEESELGLIPKGWRVAALDEIATYLNGLAMQKYPPSKNERGLPVLKIKELRQGFTDGNSDICSESIDNSYIINDGDIIFSWSGSLLVDIWCGGRCGLNQHLFKVTSASYNKWFYYMWTRYHLERFIAIAKDKATTMGHIQRKHLSEAKVLIPEPNTLAFMDSVMQPIIDLVIANKVENKTLSTIRDTLLPKLMSGEIRVPVGEVV
ncbi:restriction endonuclease subunit S [Petroclostridium xylanilyticum]|jgi:type I restriction enzyme S subunit|uniref:restriction endonuclease subunit S n=1 Tax=Petroclostridium xylanilyticum TaxID=1792311 RepID=UPI000B9820C3|nr:restriction endonuclease subunit S [Petroclostridium xylanilyticum]